jgi:hypothetical protein
MEMSDAVMEMLAERLAGRPPILPPPTRREEAPEPVRMRTWSAFILPERGEGVIEIVEATCIDDARTKARAAGRLIFHPKRLTFTVIVRRALTSPRFESAFGELA